MENNTLRNHSDEPKAAKFDFSKPGFIKRDPEDFIKKQGGTETVQNSNTRSSTIEIEKSNNISDHITSYVDKYYDGKGATLSSSERPR